MTNHERLLAFLADLSTLPDSTDLDVWGNAFKAILSRACPEIDHFTLVVNKTPGPNDIDGTVVIHRHIFPNKSESLRAHSRTGGTEPPKFRWQQFLDEAGPGLLSHIEACHPPVGFDYRQNGVYYGTVILWRKKYKTGAIDEGTHELMSALYPVIALALTNFALAAWAESPWLIRYRSIVSIVAADVELREREREVLALLAQGHSTQEVGTALCIAPQTARKHVNSLLKKCGVSNVRKLLAKYTGLS